MKDTKRHIESYINNFPLVINPCEKCTNKTDVYAECCSMCCYYYASHFEMDYKEEMEE